MIPEMTDEELKRLLEANRQHFDETADRLVDRVTKESRHFFEVSAEATRHQIGIIAEKVTRFDERLDEIEGRMERGFEEIEGRMDRVEGRMDRGFEEIEGRMDRVEGRMDRGFAETQAMIKFSHAELDRRVRTLEENQRVLEQGLNELQTRLERLEGSTH